MEDSIVQPDLLSVGFVEILSALLIAVIPVVIVLWWNQRQEARSQLRLKKAELYEDFLTNVIPILGSGENNSKTIVRELQKFNPKAAVFADLPFCKHYLDYIKSIKVNNTLNDIQTVKDFYDAYMLQVELLKAFRKDLGLKWRKFDWMEYCQYVGAKHPKLFLDTYKSDPNMAVEEYYKLEAIEEK